MQSALFPTQEILNVLNRAACRTQRSATLAYLLRLPPEISPRRPMVAQPLTGVPVNLTSILLLAVKPST